MFVANDKSEALGILERIAKERSFDLILLDDVLAAEIGKGTLAKLKHENPFPTVVEMKTSRIKRVKLS